MHIQWDLDLDGIDGILKYMPLHGNTKVVVRGDLNFDT